MAGQYGPGGALFKRDNPTPQSPQYDGYVEIDEAMLSDLAHEIAQSSEKRTKLQLAVWLKTSAKGTKFMSLKPTTSTAREAQRAAYKGGQGGGGSQGGGGRSAPPASSEPLDDEIPF